MPETHERVSRSRPERVVVTGGTEGLGRALAETFLLSGDQVAICARSGERLAGMKQEHSEVVTEQVDLSDKKQARRFVQKSSEALGGIDTLILNAATSGVASPYETRAERKVRRRGIRRLNVDAQIALTKAAKAELRKSHGSLVFITSGLVRMPRPPSGAEEYVASKAKVERFLRGLASWSRRSGVQVFCVNPGPLDTRMHAEIIERGPEPLASSLKMLKERGLLRDPALVARVISKIVASRKQFNPETEQYDIEIPNGAVVGVSDEAIAHEK